MTQNFNKALWGELLASSKKDGIPTVEAVQKKYNISNRQASAYMFALRNHSELTSDLEALKKEFVLASSIRKQAKTTKELIDEVGKLQAALDVNNAISSAISLDTKTTAVEKPEDNYTEEITAVALFGDAHVEEIVESELVNNLNVYNPDVAKARIEKFFKRLLWFIRKYQKGDFNIKHLVLAFMGDLITGYIHEELEENNSMSPVEASIFVTQLLIEGIKSIVSSELVDTLTIVCVRGNHGRTTKKKRFSTGYKNSYEQYVYQNIMLYFDNKPGYENVKFILTKSEFNVVNIYDKTWSFSHGDHFNYQGGVGGIYVPFLRWIGKQMQILPADKYAIAHWHTKSNVGRGLINGSIIGLGAYSIGHGFPPEPPQQILQLQDSKRGFTSDTSIILTDW